MICATCIGRLDHPCKVRRRKGYGLCVFKIKEGERIKGCVKNSKTRRYQETHFKDTCEYYATR